MNQDWFSDAAKVTNEYSLAAYAIAALLTGLSIVGRQRLRAKPWLFGLAILSIFCVALLPSFSRVVLKKMEQPYRISVRVISADGTRAPHATASASVPYTPYLIQDVTQLEIDESHVPADRNVTVSAKDDVLLQEGSADIKLESDRTPVATVVLKEVPGEVSGNVRDQNGGVVGVRVA